MGVDDEGQELLAGRSLAEVVVPREENSRLTMSNLRARRIRACAPKRGGLAATGETPGVFRNVHIQAATQGVKASGLSSLRGENERSNRQDLKSVAQEN
jgi:hypothetical protein